MHTICNIRYDGNVQNFSNSRDFRLQLTFVRYFSYFTYIYDYTQVREYKLEYRLESENSMTRTRVCDSSCRYLSSVHYSLYDRSYF